MPKYKIFTEWKMFAILEYDAKNEKEAKAWAETDAYEYGEYVDGSFEIYKVMELKPPTIEGTLDRWLERCKVE